MNRYISKYSKYDTHFNRTDQWKHVAWDDDEDESLLLKISAGLGMALCLIVLVVV